MVERTRRVLIWVIAALTVFTLYSLVGVIQAVMLSGAPNYSLDRAWHNIRLWGTLAGFSLALATALSVYVWRKRKR